jgi:hypothetical protein
MWGTPADSDAPGTGKTTPQAAKQKDVDPLKKMARANAEVICLVVLLLVFAESFQMGRCRLETPGTHSWQWPEAVVSNATCRILPAVNPPTSYNTKTQITSYPYPKSQ